MSYLTELVVRRIIESGILPEGTLQLLAGSATGLLDELQVQDSVDFTGSAHTAGMLRTHTNVLHGGVRLGVEADSLNCSVLGPDVGTDDPEFDLFVKGVVTEMTVKAGQKCTAIRRAIVPNAIADDVTEAITARLAKVTVGNPGHEGVRMGAWRASASARRSARRSSRCVPRPRSSTATPTTSTSSTVIPSEAPSSPPSCCAPRVVRWSRTTWSRSVRSAP